ATNQQERHDDWQKIFAHWRQLQGTGKIKSFSTPAALCSSPTWMQTNRQQLSTINFQAARETLEQTLDAEGFSRDSFEPAFKLLDDLQHVADPSVPLPDWRTQLPQSASWCFLVDRYFGQHALLTTGFVITNQPIATHAQSEELGRDLPVAGVPMIISGRSYALADLQPWAHPQLPIIRALLAVFDLHFLALFLRALRLLLIPGGT